MAEMSQFSRWMINRRTASRARRSLAKLGSALNVGPSDRVLELGSGGGGMIALLYERFHPAAIVGTDFDPHQVDAAKEYLERHLGSLPGSIALRQADALSIPYPNASFDVVFAMQMLHHVEERHTEYKNRPRALAEIRRVLRPGGSLVYSEIFARTQLRDSLREQGFSQEFLRTGWRQDIGIFRAPR